ncbi:PspC domain-containing protein [Sphingomicrobium sp. XHP0239]|uniref:PspC domain-containing protein n=1 Tax=Sphingomicrobium maritimum TaxID=3133972 RepID=UPI0031CC8DE7
MSKVKQVFNDDKRMLLGGASETAKRLGIDVLFVRIALAFMFLVVEWEPTVVAYLIVSAAFYFAARKEIPSLDRTERRLRSRSKSGSVHDMRTKLDTNDRRMMAIDQHLSSAESDKLAREIEELRAKVDAKKGVSRDPAATADDAAGSKGDEK